MSQTQDERVEWIRRSEAATRLGISPSAITQLCARGFPYRLSDGAIAWPDALYWSDFYRLPRSFTNRTLYPADAVKYEMRESRERQARRPSAQEWHRRYRAGQDETSKVNRAYRTMIKIKAGAAR
jgi:hypothetical protein